MLKLDVHRAVVGVAAPVAVDIEPVEVRIRQSAGHVAWGLGDVDVDATYLRLTKRQTRGRDAVGLRDIAPVQEMDGMGSDVVHLEGRGPGNLTLERNIPGLNVRVSGIRRLDDRD